MVFWRGQVGLFFGKAHAGNLLGLLLGYFMQEILFFLRKFMHKGRYEG